jgi:rare lipoprotein A
MKKIIVAATAVFLLVSATAQAGIVGMASYYKSGKVTANGERFNPHGLTAAHRKLRFGTKVRVTNMRNGRSVVVRINDRGPFIRGRVIDLSLGAAKVIGLNKSGVAKISYTVLN